MRRQRMGLIQTDDQLQFALSVISFGANGILTKKGNTRNAALQKSNDLTLTHTTEDDLIAPSNGKQATATQSNANDIFESSKAMANGVMSDSNDCCLDAKASAADDDRNLNMTNAKSQQVPNYTRKR